MREGNTQIVFPIFYDTGCLFFKERCKDCELK